MRTAITMAAFLFALAGATTSQAEPSGNIVRIGLLADMSGSFSHVSGAVSVEAAKLAIEKFGARAGGAPVELLVADTQNKADIASSIARKWLDNDGVDMIIDIPNSAAALAVSELGRAKGKLVIVTTAGTSDLTGKACSPTTLHWSYNTTALQAATVAPMVAAGAKKWFFLTADYAFGHALEKEAAEGVVKNGGSVVGSVKAPLNNVDFSSFLLQAQRSGADVIGLANAGADSANSIKGAQEFGLTRSGMRLASFLLTLADVHSLGLESAQGLFVASAFYWDSNDATRAYSREIVKRTNGKYPDQFSAGVYSGIVRYLQAVDELKSDNATAIVASMKAKPFDDPLFGKSSIRANGRVIHDIGLYKVKAPKDSKSEWDLYSLAATMPGEEAFGPIVKGLCPLDEAGAK